MASGNIVGTLEAIDQRRKKKDNSVFYSVKINGVEYLTTIKTHEAVGTLKQGDKVSADWGDSTDGTAKFLFSLAKYDPNAPAKTERKQWSRGGGGSYGKKDPNAFIDMNISYAKDLIVAKATNLPTNTPQAVADGVRDLAERLLTVRKELMDKHGVKDSTKAETEKPAEKDPEEPADPTAK